MKTDIVLSLVIPTHNSGKTILNLLQSINQSRFHHFNQIETVIIDDFSTDNTISLIKTACLNLKFRTRIIKINKHNGPAYARNFGVKKARGSYVLFLDSDVILKRNTLMVAFQLAKKGNVKAFTGIWDWHQKTDKFFPQFKALRDWSYWTLERKKGFRYYLFSTRIAGIEKKLFNRIGCFNECYDEPTVEDIELTYKIARLVQIKFCMGLAVEHEFEDFWPIAVKYFKRSRDWIQLYIKRLRFDPVATSSGEAAKSIIVGLAAISAALVVYQFSFIYFSLILLVLFAFLELKFWLFLIKKRGVGFFLNSIPVSLILYLIIDLGSLYGLLLYISTTPAGSTNE